MIWVVGALALLVFAASASRRRKQKIVERAWHEAVRDGIAGHYATRFGTLDRPISDAEATALAQQFFTLLYRQMGVRTFPDLMRALVLAERRGDQEMLEYDLSNRLAALVPGGSETSVREAQASALRAVLRAAGERAMAAGRASGEV